MLEKRTLVAVALLAMVGGATAWKLSRPDPYARNEKARPAAGVPTLSEDAYDEIELSEAGKPTVVLKKEDGAWKVAAPLADRADEGAVKGLTSALAKLRFQDIVAENVASHEALEIRDSDVVKLVAKKGGSPIATLKIGKKGHVRVGDEARVWTVAELPRYLVARDVKGWRDRTIARVERSAVERVEWVGPGGEKIAVQRKVAAETEKESHGQGGEKWELSEGATVVGGPLDESVPAGIVNTLQYLDAAEFGDGVTAEAAGLVAPRARVAVVTKDGKRVELLIGKDEGENTFVKRSDGDRIWKIRKSSADALAKAPLQWRDKTMTQIPVDQMKRLELSNGGDRFVFERAETGEWKPVQPQTIADFDGTKVQTIASAFHELRAQALATPEQATKLGKPQVTVTVVDKNGRTTTLALGAQVDGATLATVTGRREVFLLPDYLAARFKKSHDDFRKTPVARATNP